MTQAETMFATGGGIGIGRATAFAFARAGCQVVDTDVLESEGQAVAAAIVAGGGSASILSVGMSSAASQPCDAVSVRGSRARTRPHDRRPPVTARAG